jgi:hypothetical protein
MSATGSTQAPAKLTNRPAKVARMQMVVSIGRRAD